VQVQLKTTTRTYEKWAKVKAKDGAIAFWKLQQLEEVPLRRSVDLWKSGGLGALELALQEHHEEERRRVMAVALAGHDEM
jgi:hypothetical protein